MINFRIIARIFSLLLIVEGLFMLLSAGVASLYGEKAAYSLLYSAIITVVSGLIVYTPMRKVEKVTGKKEGYIIIAGTWIILALFGTLPYLLSGSVKHFSDAFFESMSGFTTTSATIFTEVDQVQHGILFWRSLTQWIGGMGIIFISLYVLPVFKTIYIQLPAGDFSGQPTDKIHPKIRDAATRLIVIYVILTIAEILLLITGGLPFFDAICLSFSTLSTGGFSTMNNSISDVSSPLIIITITLFMFIAGINMTFVYFGLKKNFAKILGNSEFFFYTVVSAAFIIIVTLVLILQQGIPAGKSILEGSFHVVSIITTTGFFINGTPFWSDTILIIFIVLMFTGGTAGSTSGGIKIIRLLLATKNSRQELVRLLHPNAFIPVRLDKRIIPQATIFNLLVFISLYILVMIFSSVVLTFMGYDLINSVSTSASMLANIGPGLNASGPYTDFSAMPASGKLFISGIMLLGRLELLTVMVLFTRSFYRH